MNMTLGPVLTVMRLGTAHRCALTEHRAMQTVHYRNIPSAPVFRKRTVKRCKTFEKRTCQASDKFAPGTILSTPGDKFVPGTILSATETAG